MGDGGAEGSSATETAGELLFPSCLTLMPRFWFWLEPRCMFIIRIFENSQLEGLYVGDLLYFTHWGFTRMGTSRVRSFIHSLILCLLCMRHPDIWPRLAGKLCPPRAFGPERRQTVTHTKADYKLTSGRRKHQSYRRESAAEPGYSSSPLPVTVPGTQ